MSSGSEKRSALRLGTLLAATVGLGLAAWMLRSYGAGRILEMLVRAGWLGTALIIAFHLLQMLSSALGWRAIAATGGSRPGVRLYLGFRWIREAVNNLLPLAQIGGELVAARLLQRRGIAPAAAVSSIVADLLLEIATQVLFTLSGLLLLVHIVGESGISAFIAKGLLLASVLLVGVFAALGLGLTAAMERALIRLGRSLGWPATTRIEGLHEALKACYRAPARVALGATWHLASWLLGAIEVCLILHFFGRDIGLGPGLIIESLGQASKALGFAIPAAVGVQEGGYLVVCSLLGLPPEMGIALSLMKRVREVAWGVPGLLVWQRAEASAPYASTVSISGRLP